MLYHEKARLRYPFSYWITPTSSSIMISYITTASRVPIQDEGLQVMTWNINLREKEDLAYTPN